jgi:hypothetical protein
VNTILVQLSDLHWTMKAMHFASAMARSTHSNVSLLHLILVKNPALLGSEFLNDTLSDEENENLHECAAIAEDYGVEMVVQRMQYVSYISAVVQAAEVLKASVIFAHVPDSPIRFWHRFQRWSLQQRLAAQHCRLYTLETPEASDEWVPAIRLRDTK